MLEADTHTNPRDGGGINAYEPGGTERFLQPWINDLKVRRYGKPAGECKVVVHLECILVIESETELLAQQGNESAAELGACKSGTIRVIRAASYPFAADPCEKGRLDGVRVAVGGTE